MSRNLKYYLPLICSIPFILTAIWRVIEYVPINYDGSYFIFTNLFENRLANNDDYSRWLGHLAFESFNLLYLSFSAHPTLENSVYFYSAGVIFYPLAIIISCWWILPEDKKAYFYYPLISYSTCTITTMFFAVNEMNLAHALMWPLGCLLLRDQDKVPYLAILITILMAFSYPVLIPMTPVLAIFVFRQKKWSRIWAMAILAMLTTMTATLAFHHHKLMPETMGTFIPGIYEMFDLFHSRSAAILCLSLIASLFFTGKSRFLICLCGFLIAIFIFMSNQHTFFNFLHFFGRVHAVMLAVLLFGAMIVLQRKPDFFQASTFILLATFVTWFYMKDWKETRTEFLMAQKEYSGIVKHNTFTSKTSKYQRGAVQWTSEMLSVVLQVMEKEPVRVIVNKDPRTDFPESYFGNLGEYEFKRRLKEKGVEFTF